MSKRKKVSNNPGSSQNNLSSYNRFSDLSDLSDNEEIMTENVQPVPTKIELPPIHLIGKNSVFVNQCMNDNGIVKFDCKNTSIGCRINLYTESELNKIKSALREKELQFFTHNIKNLKPFKVVLYGLHKMNTDDLKIELCTNLKLEVLQISIMNIKNPKYKEQCNYLVYLNNKSIKMNELRRQAKFVNHVSVYWDFYRKNPHFVPQCHRCSMFGHGSSFCNVNKACAYCSESHNSQECTNREKPPKCVNCGEQHAATDASCRKRLEFIEIQNRLKAKNRRRRFGTEHGIHDSLPSRNTSFNLNTSDFPQLVQKKQQHSNNTPPVSAPRSLPTTLTSSSLQKTTAPRPPNQNNNLFSFDELISLKNEMLSKLSLCKSRQDQFNVIADLSIKYLYTNNGQ